MITNGYATLAQVKSSLRITDSIDDSLIELAIESASRAIDGFSNRYFYNAGTGTKSFVAFDDDVVYIEDAQTITTVETRWTVGDSYTTWTNTDYQLEPLNGKSDGLAFPCSAIRAVGLIEFPVYESQALVRVTGTWGWASVPTAIKQATVIQASRIFKRNDSPLGVAGFGDMGVMRVSSQLDPDVRQLVEPYRIMRNFA